MTGGLMQLVAYGAQDVYLTGNPQITFFKVVYRRHTNFAIENIELTFNGNPGFNSRTNVLVVRNGDLVTKMYLKVRLPTITYDDSDEQCSAKCTKFAWTRKIGYALIKEVEVDIGGSRIDRQLGEWMYIWYELARYGDRERGHDIMIGDVPELTRLEGPRGGDGQNSDVIKESHLLYVPLKFWFNRHWGLALPLIALQYHEVRLYFTFRPFSEVIVYTGNYSPQSDLKPLEEVTLCADYIYLDSEERRRFAQVGHEYLIEQVQFTGEEPVSNSNVKPKLQFNHPTKELVWVVKLGNYVTGKRFLAYWHTDDWTPARSLAGKNVLVGLHNLDSNGCIVSSESAVNGQGNACDCVCPASLQASNVIFSPNKQNANNQDPISIVYRNATLIYINDTNLNWSELPNIELVSDQSPGMLLKNGDPETDDVANLILSGQIRVYTCSANSDGSCCFSIDVSGVYAPDVTLKMLSMPTNQNDDRWVDNRNDYAKRCFDVTVRQQLNFGLFIDGSVNPVKSAILQLNGHDRFEEKPGEYFNYVQPWQHHTNTPADGINVYSFAIHPEEHQPSGSCNFSRIDQSQLCIKFVESGFGSRFGTFDNVFTDFLDNDTRLYVFGFNYNVLRIMSGMGGLAYAN